MICCKCNEDKPNDKCIVKRNICVKCDRHERYIKNRDRDLAQSKKLYAEKYKNDPEYIERRKEYDRVRKESGKRREYLRKTLWCTDRYKIEKKLRDATRRHLFNKYYSEEKNLILGCSMQEFRDYIESKFRDGMTWENYGPKGWHIDHIKPAREFDLLIEEEQYKCFHYTNLQPLWWYENRAKG